jgi:hypothetical protein
LATAHHAKQPTKYDPDEVIPVTDVPAFGVQFRFVKRVFSDMLSRRRHRNGSKPSTKGT